MEKLDLVDVSIHSKDWKNFRKTATQEELLLLALGVKYRLNSRRVISYISCLGIVLSVILGILLLGADVGLIILIGGYIVFSFLATKFIRYSDSYSQIKRRLSAENRRWLKTAYKIPAVLAVFDVLFSFIIMYITIPYQAILLFIGTFAPNFVIAKNGVLIAIPRGCNVGNFETIGAYYAAHSLWGETEQAIHESTHRYTATIVNDMGCEQEIHSSDGVNFYTEGGVFVGKSDDGGKTVKH